MSGDTLAPAPDAPMSMVEWRPQGRASNGRCQWVAYLDAAAVTSLLDQWVGPANWRDSYAPTDKGNMWCTVEVRDPATGEWVAKTDVGTPSNMEAVKGLVSDAFKRAATLKWGAGRNVYELPVVWAVCASDSKGNPRPAPNTHQQILEECRRRGFELDGSKVADQADDESVSDDEPSGRTAPAQQQSAPGSNGDRMAGSAQKRAINRLLGDEAMTDDELARLTYDEAVAMIQRLQSVKS